MKPYITRITAWKLAKVLLHEMCDRVGHYPFQSGYSYTCNGQRIAVKAAKFVESRRAWIFWVRKIDADKIMFVAFDRDSKVANIWLMPADVLRPDGRFIVREDDVDIWDEYEIELSHRVRNLLQLGDQNGQ